MQVSQKTIERSIEILGGVLRIYREKIDAAFLKAEGAMTVNLGVRYKPVEGKMEIKTSIKFVTDQVNDSFETMFDENQDLLFSKKETDEPSVYCHRERANFPARWWLQRTLPDCRIDAERS